MVEITMNMNEYNRIMLICGSSRNRKDKNENYLYFEFSTEKSLLFISSNSDGFSVSDAFNPSLTDRYARDFKFMINQELFLNQLKKTQTKDNDYCIVFSPSGVEFNDKDSKILLRGIVSNKKQNYFSRAGYLEDIQLNNRIYGYEWSYLVNQFYTDNRLTMSDQFVLNQKGRELSLYNEYSISMFCKISLKTEANFQFLIDNFSLKRMKSICNKYPDVQFFFGEFKTQSKFFGEHRFMLFKQDSLIIKIEEIPSFKFKRNLLEQLINNHNVQARFLVPYFNNFIDKIPEYMNTVDFYNDDLKINVCSKNEVDSYSIGVPLHIFYSLVNFKLKLQDLKAVVRIFQKRIWYSFSYTHIENSNKFIVRFIIGCKEIICSNYDD